MNVIVFGGRDFEDEEFAFRWLDAFNEVSGISLVISGKSRGADKLGENWASLRGIELAEYPADWKKHGKKAGMIRNQQMIDETPGGVDLVVAFPGGRGTADMIRRAKKAGVEVIEITKEV